MRDFVLLAHIILGLTVVVLVLLILPELDKKKSSLLKTYSVMTTVVSWAMLVSAAKLYVTFYPATKTLIKAGSKPWAHSIVMETKEHWGLLLPIVIMAATGLVFTGKAKQSRRWWVLAMVISILMGIMGLIIKRIGTT